jgi:peptidoglycan/xylan/chitin deacetylase (PgdA/CDA1 family)
MQTGYHSTEAQEALLRFPRMKNRVPILIYHGFYRHEDEISGVSSEERRYYLSVSQFNSHVERLAAGNYSVCSVEKASGSRDVAFSFDDGHISNYTDIWPIIVNRGFSATFFIVADWLGEPGCIDGPQLREMSASGMEIGSHGLTHIGLAGLTDTALDRELAGSRQRLEQLLGKEVVTLALPRGLLDRRVLERARAAGYRRVCTSNAGLMNGGFEAPRLSITSFTGPETILAYARRDPMVIGRARASHAARIAVKRLIGVQNYEALCRMVLKAP